MSDYSRIARSMEMYQHAREIIPGATQLVSRRPTRYAFGASPVFVKSGSGARVIDVDGNEYIDWVSGIGAIILGYCDPVVDQAVIEQISKGTVFSLTHELEVELAEELIKRVPCAEMVRYARTGGEACAIAVRIARGATGRDKILFCGYHGWHDWYLSANLKGDESLNDHLLPGIEPTGVPKALAGTAIPFPYDDLKKLEELLEKNKGEVAAIIMEPLRTDHPPEGYLNQVIELAHNYGVLVIFDEVTTGFRPSAGGIQSVYNVVPDLAVFAKSISNGYAMGAVVGKKEVMEQSETMFISSTYWGETVGLVAALTTLREVEKRDVPKTLDQLGHQLKQGINKIAEETGCPVICTGLNYHPRLVFDLDESQDIAKVNTLYMQEMAKRGCHGYPTFYLNEAQKEPEIEQTLDAVKETFTIIEESISSGKIDDFLQCEVQNEAFRRLVR